MPPATRREVPCVLVRALEGSIKTDDVGTRNARSRRIVKVPAKRTPTATVNLLRVRLIMFVFGRANTDQPGTSPPP
jgi:hypothetical protein